MFTSIEFFVNIRYKMLLFTLRSVIYLTEYNTRCYGVTFQNNGWIKVQKFEDISDDENKIYCKTFGNIFR